MSTTLKWRVAIPENNTLCTDLKMILREINESGSAAGEYNRSDIDMFKAIKATTNNEDVVKAINKVIALILQHGEVILSEQP